jgi:exosortase/archaeosortase family protein
MANVREAVKRNFHVITMLLPILSFVPSFLILYSLHAWTFEQMYHGRTLLLIFLWLAALEIILSWEKLQKNKVSALRPIRTVLFVISLLLPTVYVVVANYYGINTIISDLASHYISSITISQDPIVDMQQKEIIASQVPISFEYLFFAVFFCLIILLAYGINILTDFSISITFLGIIGLLFTMDQLYPQKLTPLQIFVPATAVLAANFLTLIGYQTRLSFATSMPLLIATNRSGQGFGAYIDWTCAGVESLLIYTITILLFLRKTTIPLKYRITYFVIGASVTYFINILRIATLLIIGISWNSAAAAGNSAAAAAAAAEFQTFHNYYGMLYSITWIVSYPLIIIGSQALLGKIRHWNAG